MVDCFSFSLLPGSNHPSSDSFQLSLPRLKSISSNRGHSWDSAITFHGRIHCIWLFPPGSKHRIFILPINVKGVTSLGRHTRPACTQGFTRSLKTMPRMWIQLLCACVLYSMGSREFLWPYMGICDVNKSHGWNARFWLVETKFAALWLVTTMRSQLHYSSILYWY